MFATFILRTLLLYCVSDELCVCIRASQLIFRPSNLHPLHFVRPSSRRATAAILFFSFLVIFLSTSTCRSTILLRRFWREGWIANKTLQKLAGTNPVIGISSDLSL